MPSLLSPSVKSTSVISSSSSPVSMVTEAPRSRLPPSSCRACGASTQTWTRQTQTQSGSPDHLQKEKERVLKTADRLREKISLQKRKSHIVKQIIFREHGITKSKDSFKLNLIQKQTEPSIRMLRSFHLYLRSSSESSDKAKEDISAMAEVVEERVDKKPQASM